MGGRKTRKTGSRVRKLLALVISILLLMPGTPFGPFPGMRNLFVAAQAGGNESSENFIDNSFTDFAQGTLENIRINVSAGALALDIAAEMGWDSVENIITAPYTGFVVAAENILSKENYLFVMGASASSQTFVRYNLRTGSIETLSTPTDTVKPGCAAAWDENEYLYVLMGGAADTPRNLFYRYSIVDNTWENLTNATTPVNQSQGGAIVYVSTEENFYMLLGGDSESAGYFLRFDPSDNSYAWLADPPGVAEGAQLIWTGGDNIYAFFGSYAGENSSFEFKVYSISENVWKDLENTPTFQEDSADAVWNGGNYIYWGGGSDYGDPRNDNFYRFSIKDNSWVQVLDLPLAVGSNVYVHHFATWDGIIYWWQGDASTQANGGDDLYRLDVQYLTQGRFTSRVFDAEDNVDWENISWSASTPSWTVGENDNVGAEPDPLVDENSRVGTILDGSISNLKVQDGVYENLAEANLGVPASSSAYENHTDVVYGAALNSTDNLDADDGENYQVDAESAVLYQSETDYENYTLVENGTEVSGTSTDSMDTDDDTYYEVDSEGVWYYGENEPQNSTTSTAFVTAENLTFTPSDIENYLIMATAIIAHDDAYGDDRVEARLVGDGVVLGEGWATPNTDAAGTPAENYAFATHKILELDASTHEFLLQYRTESGDTAFIENARVLVIPVQNFWENSDEAQSKTDLADWQTKVSLTTPSLDSDNYLLIATAEYTNDGDAGTNETYNTYVKVTWNGENLTRGRFGGARDVIEPLVWNNFATFEVLELSGTHTFAIEYHAQGTGDNAYIENARITLIRLSNWGGSHYYADNETGGVIDSATYENVVQLTLSSNGENWLLMATAVVSTDAADGDVSTRLLLDGEVLATQDVSSGDSDDEDWSFFVLEQRALPSGTYTLTLQQKGGTVAGATYIENARVLAVPLTSAGPPYSIDLRFDSSQVSAPEADIDNLRLAINFKSTATVTYTWQIWNWDAQEWRTLDSGEVGTTEVTWENVIYDGTFGENIENFISDTPGRENIRVRLYTTGESSDHRVQIDYLLFQENYTSTGYILEVVHESEPITYQGTLNNLTVHVSFASENTAEYQLEIYDFSSDQWVLLNSGSVGSTEVTWENTITLDPDNYLSNLGGGGDNVRVRLRTSVQSTPHRLQEDFLIFYENHTPENYGLRWQYTVENITTDWESLKLRIYGYSDGDSENIGIWVWDNANSRWLFIDNLPVGEANTGWIENTVYPSYLDGDNLYVKLEAWDNTDSTQTVAHIDACVVMEENVYSTSIEIYARASADGTTWTDWEGPYTDPSGSTIGLGDNRYIQYRVDFASEDNTLTPVLYWVEITYTPPPVTPGKPQLLSPENLTYTADPTPAFRWTDVTGESGYRLVIDNDPNFADGDNLYDNANIPANENLIEIENALPPGVYWWRVAALGTGGVENWSENTWVIIIATWRELEQWSCSIQGRGVWVSVELWTAEIKRTAAWLSVESWVSGTISKTTQWNAAEGWTANPRSKEVAWELAEGWSGALETLAEWCAHESWTTTVRSETAGWKATESWQGGVKPKTILWTSAEQWTGTMKTPAEWKNVESWTGALHSSAGKWRAAECWTGEIGVKMAQWTLIESWSAKTNPITAEWKAVEEWSGEAEAPGVWSVVEEWKALLLSSVSRWGWVERWDSALRATKGVWRTVAEWAGSGKTAPLWRVAESWQSSTLSVAPILFSPDNNTITNEPTVTLRWDNLCPVDNFWLQVDNDPDFSSPTIDNDNIRENSYTATLEDEVWYWRVGGYRSGNQLRWSEVWKFQIDTDPPQFFDMSVPSSPTTETSLDYSGKVNGTGTDITWLRYSVDGGAWEPIVDISPALPAPEVSFSFNTGALSTGDHTIQIKARDAAGNEKIYAHTVTIQEAAGGSAPGPAPVPPVSFVENIEPYWHSQLPVVITAQASDADGTVTSVALYYRYRANENDPWSEWKSFATDTEAPWSWSFIAPENDGHYEFYSIATDDGNNTEAPPETADTRCGIDTTPPRILNFTINENSPFTLSREVTLSLAAVDELSEIAEMQFSEDLVQWTEWEPFDVQRTYTLSLPEGLKHVYARVRDRAGNVSTAMDEIELRARVGTVEIPTAPAGENVELDFSELGTDLVAVSFVPSENVPGGWMRIETIENLPENMPPIPVRPYRYFQLLTNLDPALIQDLTLQVRLPSWLADPGKEHLIHVYYWREEGEWEALPATFTDRDANYIYFSVSAPALGFFGSGVESETVLPPSPAFPVYLLALIFIAPLGIFGSVRFIRWWRGRPAKVELKRPVVRKRKSEELPPVIQTYKDLLAPAVEELRKKEKTKPAKVKRSRAKKLLKPAQGD